MTAPASKEANQGRPIAVLIPPAQRSFVQRVEARIFFAFATMGWLYLIVNTFVYNIDNQLRGSLPDSMRWLFEFKIFLSVILAIPFFTLISKKKLLFYTVYILLFPITRILFIVIYVLRKRSWSLLFVMVNYFSGLFNNARAYFIQFSGVILSVCLIWFVETPWSYIAGSLLALATAVFGLAISFRMALRSASLVGLFGRFFSGYRRMMDAQFHIDASIKSTPKDSLNEADRIKILTTLDASVFYNRVCLLAARRLRSFRKSSWHLLPASLSILGLYLWIGVMFSFVYYGMFRYNPATFIVAHNSFFNFFYFSMSALFFGTATEVTPAVAMSQAIYLLHRLLILFLGIIFVTEIISFRNQKYSEALDISTLESGKLGLHGVIAVINRQIE